MQVANNAELISIQDIDASLQLGKVFSKKWITLLISASAMTTIPIFCGVLFCISGEPVGEWIGFLIAGIGVAGIGLLLLAFMKSVRKKTKLCLQDAVILRAKTQKADERTEYRFPMVSYRATAIQVRFSYLDKRFIKSSIQKGKMSCSFVYNKYVDKEILIAYSPSTDNVMFIKPESEQRILAELAKSKSEKIF